MMYKNDGLLNPYIKAYFRGRALRCIKKSNYGLAEEPLRFRVNSSSPKIASTLNA